MNSNPRTAGSYTLKKGETIFCEGHKVQSLNLLLQGKLNVLISPLREKASGDGILNKSFRIFDIEQNIFMGANDIFLNENHSLSCRAGSDCNIFSYDVKTPDQVISLVNSQKDYGAYILNSLCLLIDNSCSALKKITALRDTLKVISENLVVFFWTQKEKYGFEYNPSQAYFTDGPERLKDWNKEISIPVVFNRQFIENDYNMQNGIPLDIGTPHNKRREYYSHMYSLPVELRKIFLGADMYITSYHAADASECLEGLLFLIREAFRDTDEYFKRLYNEEGESICSSFIKAAGEISAAGYDNTPVLNAVDYIISKLRETIALYETEYCHSCKTDLTYLECSYNNIRAGFNPEKGGNDGGRQVAGTEAAYESLPEELRDSARKIIEFAGIPEERSDMFLMNLAAFRNLTDKLSTDDAAKNIRNGVTSVYFEIYEAVLKKALTQDNDSRLINMFLIFGYMDEKLLSPEQVLVLYRLAGRNQTTDSGSIHNMREWLSKIYKMARDPSINEFGQDYSDVFREMKKHGQVTEKDKAAYNDNRDARLSYEILNMMKTNHKLCQGQISLYFPILHREMITRDLEKAFVTREAITESLNRILEVDFSAFHREIHFKDTDKGIEKELIMKSFIPDIILIPVFGSRSMMWQEIAGRNRSTPGRFLIPVFTDEPIDDILPRLTGNFRWELCRTMMGSAWNDVSQSSLTSEYTDYIQFYKKNRDLSEEAREKVRAQVQKYHNRMRDIFTADYEIWLNNESKGNIRLNKVVRSILFRHCPFSRAIREQLDKQPVYTDLSTQFRNQRARLARDLENRYSKYAKNTGLDPDLEQNLIFYRDK